MPHNMVHGPQDESARDSNESHAEVPKLNLRRLESIQRVLRYGAAIVLVVFVGLIALSGYNLKQINNKIELKNGELEAKREEHRQMDKSLNEKQAMLEQKQAQFDSLNRAYGETLRQLEKADPIQASKVQEAVEKTLETTAEKTSDRLRIPPRIYIHIARDDQRERAREIARQLQAKGYVVPGIENVKGKASIPPISELRYYPTSETKDVNDISEYLRSHNIPIRPNQLYSGRVRPRHYELWFGEKF